MRAAPRPLRRCEAVELVELLDLVARLCIGSHSVVSAELAWCDEDLSAYDLRVAALRLAEKVSLAHGLSCARWHRP